MAKVSTHIFFIKFAIRNLVIELKPKMLSVRDGRTDEPTDGNKNMNKKLKLVDTIAQFFNYKENNTGRNEHAKEY